MAQKISSKRKFKDSILKAIIYLSAAAIAIMLIFIIGYILYRGIPNISVEFLTSKPSLIKNTIGILPNILNTLYVIAITLAVALPIGVGAAIYLNEYAKNKKLVRAIELATEALAGIPSVIYGLVGMLIFVQFCALETSILAGSFTLAIMTLPTIVRTTQESLKSVPNLYREGALALGCGKWHMIRTVVLPSAIDGIVTGCILSVGRIVGESAALMFTAGMASEIMPFSSALKPGHAGSTLTVALYMYAKERGEFNVAFAIGAILLVLTLIINLSAKFAAKMLNKKRSKAMSNIKVENLNLWYGANQALKNINIEIPQRQITALIGPSGCGKSTFLKCLNRMNDLVEECKIEGKITLDGVDIYKNCDVNILRKKVGMVFQKPNPFPMSIYDNVAYGPKIHGIKSKTKLDEIVKHSLEQAAIWEECKDRLKKSALSMSGGQQQRLCIARALAVEPEIILMDEPTSALDPISTSKIEKLITELKKKYTIIMVTHNMQQAARIADKTAFFLMGEIIEYDSTDKMFSSPSDKRTKDYITGKFG